MVKNLLIVESPAKAKTIERYLGKDFTVKSSFGHIRDLVKTKNGVDIENDYKPKYVISPEKKKVVKELKDWVKKAEEVWLATDEDREGEAISWHLCQVLGLDMDTTKRIVFREITKPALEKAISMPRSLDINLVNAQQARRVLDRLVGFELSELLWKKVKGKLSAGRVQSVAVKLIVERERAIQEFESKPFFKASAIFDVKNTAGKIVKLKADLDRRYDTEEEAQTFLENCIGAEYAIENIAVKPMKRSPSAPFTTSTLQQEASRKLGFSVSRTMINAQRLYEAGHITYMRTDSTTLSGSAIQAIAEQIEQQYGAEYVHTRQYKGKTKNAQEAHEAVRPTRFGNTSAGGDRDQQRLYELIWKRTVASQMAQARLEKTEVTIGISTQADPKLVATGEVIKFDGFLKVYLEGTDDEEENEAKGMLPPLEKGQMLDLNYLEAIQRFTRPPARFTEASLVKKMEELGIGRPSTYAPTISKITEKTRGYILKDPIEGRKRDYSILTLKADKIEKNEKSEITGADKKKLHPSDLGLLVSDFLDEHFDNIMNYRFTALIEEEFDKIAAGGENWNEMIDSFYKPFHENVAKTLEKAERVTGERHLGKDPKSGRTILVRMSRFGPVAQVGTADELEEGEKPKYANLKPGQSLETIDLESALDLFQLPKKLGEYEGLDVIIGAGRYGPYVKYDGKFISIPKGEDPLEISMERATELIEEKKKADAPIASYMEKPITKGAGRYGPFLKWNNIYVNIPKGTDPASVDGAKAVEMVKAKLQADAEKIIHKWEEENIVVEKGRYGPFIRFGKKNVKIPKTWEGVKVDKDVVDSFTLSDVKAIIAAAVPGAFGKKKKK
ncbi:MAG: type I DNA topoisomerase [Bacteroidota bacterium]